MFLFLPYHFVLSQSGMSLGFVSKKIWEVLGSISKEGISILIVDKLSEPLIAMSNFGYIIERGKIKWSGDLSSLSESVASKFLGV